MYLYEYGTGNVIVWLSLCWVCVWVYGVWRQGGMSGAQTRTDCVLGPVIGDRQHNVVVGGTSHWVEWVHTPDPWVDAWQGGRALHFYTALHVHYARFTSPPGPSELTPRPQATL